MFPLSLSLNTIYLYQTRKECSSSWKFLTKPWEMKGNSNRYTKQLLFICEELVSYGPFIRVKNKTLCLCGAYICLRHKKKGV